MEKVIQQLNEFGIFKKQVNQILEASEPFELYERVVNQAYIIRESWHEN